MFNLELQLRLPDRMSATLFLQFAQTIACFAQFSFVCVDGPQLFRPLGDELLKVSFAPSLLFC